MKKVSIYDETEFKPGDTVAWLENDNAQWGTIVTGNEEDPDGTQTVEVKMSFGKRNTVTVNAGRIMKAPF